MKKVVLGSMLMAIIIIGILSFSFLGEGSNLLALDGKTPSDESSGIY